MTTHKYGSIVWFPAKTGPRWYRFRVLSDHPEFNAITVCPMRRMWVNSDDWIAGQPVIRSRSGAVTEEEKRAVQHAKRLAKAKARFADIIQAWNAGCRDWESVWAKVGGWGGAAYGRFHAAKRRGLLT